MYNANNSFFFLKHVHALQANYKYWDTEMPVLKPQKKKKKKKKKNKQKKPNLMKT